MSAYSYLVLYCVMQIPQLQRQQQQHPVLMLEEERYLNVKPVTAVLFDQFFKQRK